MTRVHGDPVGPVSICVSFDIEQLGAELCWAFQEGVAGRDIYRRVGPNAGSVHLMPEDILGVHVVAYQSIDDPETSQQDVCIRGCTLMTVRRLHERNYLPSPFQDCFMPSVEVGNFVLTKSCFDEGLRAWRQDLVSFPSSKIKVAKHDSTWKLSMLLTVGIRPKDQKAEKIRVFRFDPEAQVGTGTSGSNHG